MKSLNRIIRQSDYTELGVNRRKSWEIALALKTATRTDVNKRKIALGLGAGLEPTTWKLSPMFDVVIPTDLYSDMGEWAGYGSGDFLRHPSRYAPDIYKNVKNVIPMHQDMTYLNLPRESVDFIYSSGSIEHVIESGGSITSWDSVATAAREAGRVLKRGGVMSISTEWKLNDKEGWGFDNVRLFDIKTLYEYLIEPSGLELMDELDVTPDYDLSKAMTLQDAIDGKIPEHGEIALSAHGFVFTSIHLALRKP